MKEKKHNSLHVCYRSAYRKHLEGEKYLMSAYDDREKFVLNAGREFVCHERRGPFKST